MKKVKVTFHHQNPTTKNKCLNYCVFVCVYSFGLNMIWAFIIIMQSCFICVLVSLCNDTVLLIEAWNKSAECL